MALLCAVPLAELPESALACARFNQGVLVQVLKKTPLMERYEVLAEQQAAFLAAKEAQEEEAARLHGISLTLSERETALQATQRAQSKEAARLQRLALSLSEQERAQLYARLVTETYVQVCNTLHSLPVNTSASFP